jgi:hypothetical protein
LLLFLIVIAGLAAGGYYGWQWWQDRGSDKVRAAPRPCVTPTHPPAPAQPAGVRVRVLNGTKRVGLAHTVSQDLRRRGFRVVSVGNSRSRSVTTTVTASAALTASAITLGEHVHAKLVPDQTVRVIVLTIGRDFRGLVPPAAATTAHSRDLAAASPSPPACASSHP